MENSFLEKLQSVVERELNSQDFLNEVPVIAHQHNNLERCVTEFVEAGAGFCVIVLNPMPIKVVPGKDDVSFEEIQMRIQLIESVTVRWDRPSSLSLAERISRHLHHFNIDLPGWSGWVSLRDKEPWKELKDPLSVGRYILELSFTVNGFARERVAS